MVYYAAFDGAPLLKEGKWGKGSSFPDFVTARDWARRYAEAQGWVPDHIARGFEDANSVVSVPDNDPRLGGAGPGMCKFTDGTMYVPESYWLEFLVAYARRVGGDEVADDFRLSVTH